MQIDDSEPLPLKSKRDEGYNKVDSKKNRPATSGFSRFWEEMNRETARRAQRFESVITSPLVKFSVSYLIKFYKLLSINQKLLWPMFLLLIMVLLPWISEASISSQTEAELKAFTQPMDPIKTGQLAISINQYMPPSLYADPDVVVLNQMTKNESYTLAQQLSVNTGNEVGAPERQAPTYTLQSGETITEVAKKFDIHVGTILSANSIAAVDMKKIKPGTVLKIPSSDTDTSDSWLVAINKAEADAKAQAQAEARAKAEAAAKKKKNAQVALAANDNSIASTTRRGTSYGSVTVIGTSYEQCLPWAREQTGIQIHGYAGDVQPTQSEPRVGGIALDRFFGHASVVVGIDGDSVIVHEANFIRGRITERVVSKAAIRGYVY